MHEPELDKIKEEAAAEAKEELEKFKKFAFQGNMIQMAVAFILSTAFGKVVTALSSNLIMPVVNFTLNLFSPSTQWRTITWTPFHGMTFELGQFLGSFIDFVIIATVLYVIWKKILHGKDASDDPDPTPTTDTSSTTPTSDPIPVTPTIDIKIEIDEPPKKKRPYHRRK